MKIGILCGGNSAEAEISLMSGQNVYQALKNKGLDCCLIKVDFHHLAALWQQSFDYAFILLHGKGGEDGQIQAELAKRNIAYSGSNSEVSKICMDKLNTKQVWQQYKLPCVEYALSHNAQLTTQPSFAMPWIVKPTTEGSSVGISKVSTQAQLPPALKLAHQYDEVVMVERYLKGKEYTVAVYQGQAGVQTLPIIEIAHNLDFLDYHNKYFDKEVLVKHICPAPLSTKLSKQAQQLALKAFEVLGCKDWARVDFMIEDEKIYLIEVNTVPGMTTASLIPIELNTADITIADFVLKIINHR